jgi:hypothetical protein
MRILTLILAGAALASCTNAPPGMTANDISAQHQLAALLAGKAAGAPLNCIPSYQGSSSTLITHQAIAFTPNPGQVYVSDIAGTGCEGLANPNYTLITTSHGPGGLCSGDIVKIVDPHVGSMMGACSLGPIIPYNRP